MATPSNSAFTNLVSRLLDGQVSTGEDDIRCPVSQAEELFITLRWLGKPVEFWRFPGEDHELSRSGSPFHRRRRFEIILGWFTERLAPVDA